MTWQGRRVFITGIDGFVGARLAEVLLAMGASVEGLVHQRPERGRSALRARRIEHAVRLLVGDVARTDEVHDALVASAPDCVFHLAAETIVTAAQSDPMLAWETNVRGTYNVLHAAAQLPALVALVVASSDKAYGASPVLPYTEDMPLRGGGIYDSSKAAAELVAASGAARYRLPLGITRCANIFGPADLKFTRLVPDVARAIARGARPVIRGDGSHERDFLYVDDAVDGYLALARHLATRGKPVVLPVNFGTGTSTTVRRLVELAVSVSAHPHLEPIVLAQPTPFEIPVQSVDAGRARAVLGWLPKVSLRDGLARTVAWYAEYAE